MNLSLPTRLLVLLFCAIVASLRADPAIVTLTNLVYTYDGTPKSVSVTTVPAGLNVVVYYAGSTTVPTEASAYDVLAQVIDSHYEGSCTATLVINRAPASVIIGNVSEPYDGTPKSVSVVTVPPNLSVVVTYNGSTNAPTEADYYYVVAQVSQPNNYLGSTNGSLLITPLPSPLTIGNLSQTYDGAAKSVSITTTPPDHPVNVTYSGATNPPTNAGSYTVVATFPGANYSGVTNTLVINQAAATLTLGNFLHTYDGTVKSVSATTDPAGLPVALSYNGIPPETWIETMPPNNLLNYSAQTLLADGRILVNAMFNNGAPHSQIYDPVAGTWSNAGQMQTPRISSFVTLLNGKVLAAGGQDASEGTPLATAELFDPATQSWTFTGSLPSARSYGSVVRLSNGKVLLGGAYDDDGNPLPFELYDPATGTWSATGTLNQIRRPSTLTLLADGRVLATAVSTNFADNNLAELYDPTNGTWAPTGSFLENGNINSYTVTRLLNGKVLVAGGNFYSGSAFGILAHAELYDPTTGTWTFTGSMQSPHASHSATLLSDGRVIIAGGADGPGRTFSNAELYDPNTGLWTIADPLISPRAFPSTLSLPDGRAVFMGGFLLTNISGIFEQIFVPGIDTYYPAGLVQPVDAGAYPAIGRITDPNYVNVRVTNTLTIVPASVVVTLTNLSQTYDGTAKAVSVTTEPPGVAVTVTYNGLIAGAGNWQAIRSMNTSRSGHTATLLADGRILVAGGFKATDGSGLVLSSAEIFDPATGVWTLTGAMSVPRGNFTATLLPSGKVLVAGGARDQSASAELYDPATGVWSATGTMSAFRENHTATLLPNGRVIVTGGQKSSGITASSEIYDPATETWSATGSLDISRLFLTTTLLANGRVLAVGGGNETSGVSSTPVLYDSTTGIWTATGTMQHGHFQHTASLLPNGKVLVAGGGDETFTTVAGAEVYDRIPGTWTATDSMHAARSGHTAVSLRTGPVLIAGGADNNNNILASAELYDPATRTWAITSPMSTARVGHTMTLLPDGSVLVTGGVANSTALSSAEKYYPIGGPVDGGSYAVVATVVDKNYQGSVSNTLVINSAASLATVTLSNLAQPYTGTARPVSVTTVPPGLSVNVTYEGSFNPPTNRGSYTVVATVTDPSYYGSATDTLFVDTAPQAIVTLSNLTQIYDGTPKSVSATTTPPGLTVDFTYNGSSSAPTAGGSYTVIGTVNDPIYHGSATNILTIVVPPTITTQPITQIISPGSPAILNATPSGGGSYSYQWLFNGANIAGATASTYQTTQSGQYSVVITNVAGSVTSSVVSVSFLSLSLYAGLTIDGPIGSQYRIDYLNTTNLSWSNYATITLPSSPYVFIDTNSPAIPARLYRAVQLP